MAELLHPALHALPDVTLAVEPQSLRILDVNRAREAFGHDRARLGAMGLDALLDLPREDLARFVQAAAGRPVDVGIRLESGAVVHASACASSSAGAAAAPCVLIVLRESPEHARALDEIERIRAVLHGALEALERLSEQRHAAAPPSSSDVVATEPPAPRLPDLTLPQYVSLCVETELQPARAREINERYGLLADAARALLDRAWRDKLAADPALEAERVALHGRYLAWFQAQGWARGDSGVAAAPVPAAEPPKPAAPPVDPQLGRATALSPGVPARPLPPPQAPPMAPSMAQPMAQPMPQPMPQPMVQPVSPTVTQAPTTAPADVRSTIAAVDYRGGAALPFKPAGAPDLTVEQYASLHVELEAYPDRRGETLARYGIHGEAAWNACEEHWAARIVADAPLRQRWMKLRAERQQQLAR